MCKGVIQSTSSTLDVLSKIRNYYKSGLDSVLAIVNFRDYTVFILIIKLNFVLIILFDEGILEISNILSKFIQNLFET